MSLEVFGGFEFCSFLVPVREGGVMKGWSDYGLVVAC